MHPSNPARPCIFAILLLFTLFLTIACTGTDPTPTPSPTSALTDSEAQGMELFQGQGRCATCHSFSPGTVIVGPSLAGIATNGATRVEGLTAQEYIEQSILDPDAYRPPGFEQQQMPTTLARELTIEEIDAIVAYLMTLTE
jgi:nitric oxide reductase subunit C